ncbi:MAG: sugar phosphate isomerase/epimerase family protein, partial [bacterium]
MAIRFGICNELFEGWPLERVLTYCAAVGYDGVEVAPFTLAEDIRDLAPEAVVEMRRAAEQAGIDILGLHWLLSSPEGLSLNGPDDAVRRETLDFLNALVGLCAGLGGRVMVFGSPGQRTVAEDDSAEAAWQRAVAMFQACGEEAERRGVTIALEPLTEKETNFLNTRDEAVRLIEAIDCPAVRLHLDVKAMVGQEERPPAAIIRESKEHLAHVHANDANLRGPGFGDVDFRPIAAALADIGYD